MNVETKRPGQASVQYGDVRGEAAADIADVLGGLSAVGKALGFRVRGMIVGIRMFAGPAYDSRVSVTVQVFEGGSWDDIKVAREASGGTLPVTEHDLMVPLVDFIRCFKRFSVGLFVRDTGVHELKAVMAGD